MLIPELAVEINGAAERFEIGLLQQVRARLHSLRRVPCAEIFNASTIHHDYAFHVGGRKELQFNIGEEEHEGATVIRHGVAFSLQLSQTLPAIGPLIPKIMRFNDFMQTHPEDFPGFRMWHYDDNGQRSPDRPVGPISDELAVQGNFIMLGRWVPATEIDVSAILSDFDRLLPLYVYVETYGPTPKGPAEPDVFRPGCPEFVVRTKVDVGTRTLDIALRHKALQMVLYGCLCNEAGAGNVSVEHRIGLGVCVDVAVRNGHRMAFYELKVASTAMSCMRAAVGQLLEYAYWPSADRANELIIVGEAEMDEDASTYLRLLRERFKLPLWYRRIDIGERSLEPKT